MPLPIVVATAVPKMKAATKFQNDAQTTARKGVRTRVETTVAMELAASCQPLENSKASVRTMTAIRRLKLAIGESSALDDHAFDYIGDVFAFIHGGFYDLEDFFPLDDLDGVFFFVEKLGDESPAETVAFVFEAVDLDAMLHCFFWSPKGFDGGGDFHGGRDENSDEVRGAFADGVDAIEDETASCGVDEVDDVVKPTTKLVNIFAVEGRDEGLVQLGQEVVRDFVAFMLDGLDALDLLGDAGVMREHFEEGFGAFVNILGLFGEEVKKALFARHNPLQKSIHGVGLSLKNLSGEARRV